MNAPNPNTQMPKWLIYALVGKAVALVLIVVAVLYFTGVL
ncbi:hypothetical protein ABID20_000937 [Rhizobium alvei]